MSKPLSELGHPFANRRYPKIERIENCIMEIDYSKGTIKVQYNGRYRVVIRRIAISLLHKDMIDLVSNNSILDDKVIL